MDLGEGARYGIIHKNRRKFYKQFRIRSPDLCCLAGIATSGSKTCIRHPHDTGGEDARLELVQTEIWGANYAFLR